jgi:uncharacterized protein
MDHIHAISAELGLRLAQVVATVELLDGGNTLPFIARYRKEATGGLDEEQIRQIGEWIARLRAMDERREAILKSVDEQGKLTDELRAALLGASTLTALEDLYQPYRPKRRTRAGIAREKGLQPLADLILMQERTRTDLDELARPFLSEAVPTVEDAWAGAQDITAETISDHPDVRRVTRQKALQWGALRCERIEGADDPKKVFQLYYEFELRVDRVRPHQTLAMNRGEAEKVLRLRVDVAERDWLNAIEAVFRPDERSALAGKLREACRDAAERLLLPAIERDVRRELTEKAEMQAIGVFGANLRALLSQPPLQGYTVLGLDPGFRTGCKVAVVDPTGKLLDTGTIYPHEPHKRWEESLRSLGGWVIQHNVTLIAIGNGTASRETEQLVAELIRHMDGADTKTVRYLIVSEAGASVYSASPLARAELPGVDVSLRGAASIARRAQDPLAELVKIDPKAIGVGMYQHDVDQGRLSGALSGVVESAVNQVGVDVNTASPALLTYVAGIGPKLAEKIVAHRDANGVFRSRKQLREVSGLGPKAFEQSAGFLRILGGSDPLDASAIHPESYRAAGLVMTRAGIRPDSPIDKKRAALEQLLAKASLEKLAGETGVGIPTLKDILEQLIRPGRDPRSDLPTPILRSDVLSLDDLAAGMQLKGTVRNVVDFGAFVDIGVKQDGLLHHSRIPFGTVLKAGEVIEVEILQIDAERGRISLGWPGSEQHGKI